MPTGAVQTTLEEGVSLAEVTFCVVDLETTGGSPADSRITEIGAVKYRGGERIGVFETLVNPEVPIPRFITHLTGIDDLAVAGAPPIEWALPSFSEFAGGCAFVAHNARFDFTFVNTALSRLHYDPIPPPPVCTPPFELEVARTSGRSALRTPSRTPQASICSRVATGGCCTSANPRTCGLA